MLGHGFMLPTVGADSDEGTPDPIPNSEVKLISGDGSAGLRLWESSTVPTSFFSLNLFKSSHGFTRVTSFWSG